MLWKEITIGFLLAGFIGLLGNDFFNSLFIEDAPPAVQTIENVIVGPIIAVLSFVCSIGNAPLAAVLWSGGISFAGVIAFIFADLIVLPIVAAYIKYYGRPFALRITALMFVTIVIAALLVDGTLQPLGLIPDTRPSRVGHLRLGRARLQARPQPPRPGDLRRALLPDPRHRHGPPPRAPRTRPRPLSHGPRRLPPRAALPVPDPDLRPGLRDDLGTGVQGAAGRRGRAGGRTRILDLGCGTGTLAIQVKQREPRAEVVGLDADPAMLSQAREKAERAGVELTLTEGFSTELPFEDRSFDLVLSTLFFHHLDPEPKRQTAREIARVLRTGGELHVADWGKPSDPVMAAAFLGIRLLDGFENTADNARGDSLASSRRRAWRGPSRPIAFAPSSGRSRSTAPSAGTESAPRKADSYYSSEKGGYLSVTRMNVYAADPQCASGRTPTTKSKIDFGSCP